MRNNQLTNSTIFAFKLAAVVLILLINGRIELISENHMSIKIKSFQSHFANRPTPTIQMTPKCGKW
jgi:hypothetical protein